jgi:hypothetical protein
VTDSGTGTACAGRFGVNTTKLVVNATSSPNAANFSAVMRIPYARQPGTDRTSVLNHTRVDPGVAAFFSRLLAGYGSDVSRVP